MNREEKVKLVNGVMEGETLKIEESRNLVGNGYRCVIKTEKLNFYVNGKEVLDAKVDPEWTLLWYLRNKLGLTGTKLGCAEGGCGACTVMVSKMNRSNGKMIHLAVNACLTPVCAMHGLAVTTVEGIGSVRTKLHPVQERIAKAHGSQCGFCTPGMVMSMYALLRSVPKPTAENLEIAFQGNLCRCTGYRAIVEGFSTFIEDWERSRSCLPERGIGECAMGDACCKRAFSSASIPNEIFDASNFRPYDPTQEPIFPPRLQLSSDLDEQYLVIKGKNVTWYRPTKLIELLELKQRYPDAKIVVGNTEVGVEVKFKRSVYPVLVQPCLIREMHEVTETSTSLRIGASVTLSELEEILKHRVKTKPEHRTRIFSAIINMLHWFAGRQIRNVAAVGGNIMTGSPISDLNPVFMAAGLKLNLCSLRNGQRTIQMDHTFFVGYRRNVVAPEEVLISIEIPFSNKDQYLVAFKQARRREDDIAIVNMALNVSFEAGTDVVREAHLTFGGMAPTTVFARKTCRLLIGRKWEKTILEPVYDSLLEELPLADNAPGGNIKYRRSLTLSLFLKGFVRIATSLQLNFTNVEALPEELKDAGESFHYKVPKSSQYYEVVSKDQELNDPIGRPIVHASAYKQASGEAIYLDDLPKLSRELYLSLVLSTRAHAKILKIDPSKALAMEGVVAFFSSKDLPPEKKVGPIFHDEEVFVSEKVTSQGQIIGAIVAIDQATAQKATKMVEIEYEDIQPIIISMEDAIERESFFSNSARSIVKGDADLAFAESDHILEGEVKTGGQEHFYFETHSAYAIPRDEDELEIFSSTQHPSEVQRLVAYTLDMPINKIAMRVKRIGGGFGGKESRAIIVTIPVALAAHRLRRPVRCMLDRDEDMMTSGTRHPFLFKYKVGFNKNGVINVVKINIYNNGGYSRDLSIAVLERAVFHFENSYRIPVSHVHGIVCKTNLPSNTAFRGFGGPQGMFAAETMIRQIAEFLKMNVLEVAERNLYKEGDVTHYNQVLTNCTIERCWQECLALSRYKERLVKVERYNKEHRFRKRGIAVVPTKFGIAFTAIFLNQAAALVHVYTDGSILLSHGGVEMGQGLHTKMIQIASRVLKVPSSKIHIAETATDKVPNTSATAASSGSDLNGMAVLNACTEVMKRLQPIIKANPKGTWEEWIKTAYFERISLSATGFYAMPDIGYSFDTNSGLAFSYFTYGVACSEVEIDCLTGDHQVLRTDIVMDLGQSLNPAIDVGQIEGAFVQGYGLFTLEETVYSPTGIVYTRGPGAYKLPGFADIPQEFNVSLLKGVSNPRAVYSSKAVGEPPLFLASSIFFAIKEAIKAARKDMNIEGYFRLDTPATAARIRTACVDNLTMKIPEPDIKRQWNVVP